MRFCQMFWVVFSAIIIIIYSHRCTSLSTVTQPFIFTTPWHSPLSEFSGSLAEWLADHPVMLGAILPMVLQGLVKPELSVSSVSTLKRICRECRHDLCPYAQDILTVSQVRLAACFFKKKQKQGVITVCVLTRVLLCRMCWWKKSTRWVNSLQHPSDVFYAKPPRWGHDVWWVLCVFLRVCVQSSQSMWLMQALGFLLSALPVEEILVRLHSLIAPHIQQLDTLAQQEVKETHCAWSSLTLCYW